MLSMKTKSLFTAIVLAIFVFSAGAQTTSLPVDETTGLITYQDVVEEAGNKDEFFNRAIAWINEYYSNPVDVTKTRDPESGLIKGLHRFKIKNTDEEGTETDAGVIQYEFKLEFKEGRYRYKMSDFVLRQASKIPVENWLEKDDPQSKSYLQQVDDFAREWIKNMKAGMKGKVEKKDDEW
jgi:hypothetical protein